MCTVELWLTCVFQNIDSSGCRAISSQGGLNMYDRALSSVASPDYRTKVKSRPRVVFFCLPAVPDTGWIGEDSKCVLDVSCPNNVVPNRVYCTRTSIIFALLTERLLSHVYNPRIEKETPSINLNV